MTPIEISVVVFLCLFGGALLGMWLRGVLPAHHLSSETVDLLKLSGALIGTMAALLLGLLVAAAQSSYQERSGELTQMAANVLVIDRELAHYGPETDRARDLLKALVARSIDQIWSSNTNERTAAPATRGEPIFDMILGLSPRTDEQREIRSQAESMLINLGQTRYLLFAQSGWSIPIPFIVVIVFWSAMLFVSFGLLAPRHATAIVTLLIGAISIAGALFLILELEYPFSGLIEISAAPLQTALSLLGR